MNNSGWKQGGWEICLKLKYVGETGTFGYPVVIVETTASDGYVWYKIFSDENPPARYGWVHSDLVQLIQVN